ncbi:MAG: hypothetical protein M3336_17130 [Chloroflexota bacterium]|nr:hypothetical protein [Chloroflexota bacterium]
MTVARWLATRTPQPPDLLLKRISDALGDMARRPAVDTSEVCLAAAEGIVSRLLHQGTDSRDQALDLLAADSLVTYAFEAASDRPEEMGDQAARAMSRISRLAGSPRL